MASISQQLVKSHALKHSQKSWPVGLLEVEAAPNILLVEGMPDFIAAHEVVAASPFKQQWAPVAILLAASSIPAHAIDYFTNKRVVIVFHHDREGQGVKAAMKWRGQLQAVAGCRVSLFDTKKLSDLAGGQIKDLNDYLRLVRQTGTNLPAVNTILPNP